MHPKRVKAKHFNAYLGECYGCFIVSALDFSPAVLSMNPAYPQAEANTKYASCPQKSVTFCPKATAHSCTSTVNMNKYACTLYAQMPHRHISYAHRMHAQ
jgi:hypothetical protein